MDPNPTQEFRHASFRGRIGIARTDITPPFGIYARNWGAATHDVADSIHRSLTLTALTLEPLEGGRPLVLIEGDLGWWRGLPVFRKFRDRLLDQLSLQPAELIIALSHTHAGPPLMEADESLPGNDLLEAWMNELAAAALKVARSALDQSFDATLDWSSGRCGLATVRDFPDPDPANDRFICGYHPDGAADDTLLVGRITDRAGKLCATLVNYACHPTTLAWENTAISPDYVGAMRDTIQQATDAPALFLLGACGDQAPRYQYVGDTGVADRHGRQLGFAALGVLEGMEPAETALAFAETVESGAPLAVWKHQPRQSSQRLGAVEASAELPLKDWPSAEELEKQRLACTDRALEERLRRRRNIRRGIGDDPTFSLPIHGWRIGDAVLVGCCCEPYAMLQRELRQRHAGRTVVCMNLINGTIGYLPPAGLYDFEVYPAWQTPFDRGSLERTIDAMDLAIADLLGPDSKPPAG